MLSFFDRWDMEHFTCLWPRPISSLAIHGKNVHFIQLQPYGITYIYSLLGIIEPQLQFLWRFTLKHNSSFGLSLETTFSFLRFNHLLTLFWKSRLKVPFLFPRAWHWLLQDENVSLGFPLRSIKWGSAAPCWTESTLNLKKRPWDGWLRRSRRQDHTLTSTIFCSAKCYSILLNRTTLAWNSCSAF